LKDFRNLKVWEKSHQLTLEIYIMTKNFPKDELYGLRSQIRRASVSISANIAEGCGRASDAELSRFSQIAMGSASELEYHILLIKDLNFIDIESYNLINTKIVEIKKMLSSLIKKLKATN
jgi:four helix bundle protein